MSVLLLENFWRRFGEALNVKSAQLVDFSTCYADIGCGGRILHHSTTGCNLLIANSRNLQKSLFCVKVGAELAQDTTP